MDNQTTQQPPKATVSLENLEAHLELFIENVRQIELFVSDVQPHGQTVLNQKLNGMITGLRTIDKLRSQVQDVYVPLEVCYDYIDQNRNPQLFTRDCLEKTQALNESVKGKIEGFQKLKGKMLLELFKTFPNEMDNYRSYRNDSLAGGDDSLGGGDDSLAGGNDSLAGGNVSLGGGDVSLGAGNNPPTA